MSYLISDITFAFHVCLSFKQIPKCFIFLDYKDLKVHLKGARKTKWIYICTKTNTVYLKANTVHWVSCLGKGLHSECFVWCNDFGLLLIILLVFSNKDVLSFCVIICGRALRLILIVLFSISFSLLLSQLATFSAACLMICNLLVLSKEVDFSAKKTKCTRTTWALLEKIIT